MSVSTAVTLTDATKPTVVLVHGAFADSSSWNGVIAHLRGDGYPVMGVASPLRGLHGDAEFLRSVLDSVDGPIVIAGHSYGGSVMSVAADGNPKVRALVSRSRVPNSSWRRATSSSSASAPPSRAPPRADLPSSPTP